MLPPAQTASQLEVRMEVAVQSAASDRWCHCSGMNTKKMKSHGSLALYVQLLKKLFPTVYFRLKQPPQPYSNVFRWLETDWSLRGETNGSSAEARPVQKIRNINLTCGCKVSRQLRWGFFMCKNKCVLAGLQHFVDSAWGLWLYFPEAHKVTMTGSNRDKKHTRGLTVHLTLGQLGEILHCCLSVLVCLCFCDCFPLHQVQYKVWLTQNNFS